MKRLMRLMIWVLSLCLCASVIAEEIDDPYINDLERTTISPEAGKLRDDAGGITPHDIGIQQKRTELADVEVMEEGIVQGLAGTVPAVPGLRAGNDNKKDEKSGSVTTSPRVIRYRSR